MHVDVSKLIGGKQILAGHDKKMVTQRDAGASEFRLRGLFVLVSFFNLKLTKNWAMIKCSMCIQIDLGQEKIHLSCQQLPESRLFPPCDDRRLTTVDNTSIPSRRPMQESMPFYSFQIISLR
jgi:hypothetical protein